MSVGGNNELLQSSRAEVKNTVAYKRVISLVDEGSFVEIDTLAKSEEHFAEVITGFGLIDGCPTYVFAQNSDFAGGAMSKAQVSKIKKVMNLAVKTGAPVIGIYDSVGAQLKQGADMLAAYGEMMLANNNLSGVVPQISLVLGPCIGTSAMIAASADIVVMSEQAELTLETSGQDSNAENAAKSGIAHIVASSEEEAIRKVRELLPVLPTNNLAGAPITDEDVFDPAATLTSTSSAKDMIAAIADANAFIELSEQFGPAVVTGLAQMAASTVGMVVYSGKLDADACSKAARFVRFCDAFSLPVISLVNAEGFECLRDATKLSNAYSEATTAKITIVTGEAYGPVYIALAGRGANSDITVAWPDAAISPLAPATAAMFLWSDRLAGSSDPIADRKKLIEEFKETEASPFKAAADGFVEDIITPEETRDKVISYLEILAGKRVSTLPKKHGNIQL